MKKKVLTIVAAVLAVALIAGSAVAYKLLPQPLNYDIDGVTPVGTDVEIVSESVDEVTIKKSGDSFKVLAFTDIHLDGKNETSYMTVENIVKNIEREKPDLVLFGGDNVTSALNKKRAHQFAQLFENLGVYWAGVLGNHEGDNGFSLSRADMVELFSSYDHCLMKNGVDGIFGNCNYAVTVLNGDDTVKHVYYFLDTGDEMSSELMQQYNIPEDDPPYDGAKTEQVEWYTAKNDVLKEKYGDFKSTLVVHIPLPQYDNALNDGVTYLYGEKLEGICSSGFDSGLFDALKAGGTTKSVFCGHDHLNTFGFTYDGILLSYLQPSGYGSYTTASKLGYEEKDWLQGCTVFELNADGTFTQSRLRNCEVNK